MKTINLNKIRIGDNVSWNGSPNELSCWLNGTVISIKNGIASVSKDFSNDIRQVSIKILKKQ